MADEEKKRNYVIEVKGKTVFVNGVENNTFRTPKEAKAYAEKYASDRRNEDCTTEVK